MAITYQLQNSLFGGEYFVEQNDSLKRVNNTEDINNLNSVFEYLQTLTDIFQDIEVCTYKLEQIYTAPGNYL